MTRPAAGGPAAARGGGQTAMQETEPRASRDPAVRAVCEDAVPVAVTWAVMRCAPV
jgi:hypothetical protein